MHILITSGGTREAIDSVRSITNHSTGSLGKILAEMALAKGHQVTLITTPTALKPDPHPQLRLLLIQNVEELPDARGLDVLYPLGDHRIVVDHTKISLSFCSSLGMNTTLLCLYFLRIKWVAVLVTPWRASGRQTAPPHGASVR